MSCIDDVSQVVSDLRDTIEGANIGSLHGIQHRKGNFALVDAHFDILSDPNDDDTNEEIFFESILKSRRILRDRGYGAIYPIHKYVVEHIDENVDIMETSLLIYPLGTIRSDLKDFLRAHHQSTSHWSL